MNSIDTTLRKLTFDDLRDWSGETILNRGKGYVKQVDQLSRTEDNALVAWVKGNEQYPTSVRVAEKTKCWQAVRDAVLRYLETGQHPAFSHKTGKQSGWPLPSPEVEPPAEPIITYCVICRLTL